MNGIHLFAFLSGRTSQCSHAVAESDRGVVFQSVIQHLLLTSGVIFGLLIISSHFKRRIQLSLKFIPLLKCLFTTESLLRRCFRVRACVVESCYPLPYYVCFTNGTWLLHHFLSDFFYLSVFAPGASLNCEAEAASPQSSTSKSRWLNSLAGPREARSSALVPTQDC